MCFQFSVFQVEYPQVIGSGPLILLATPLILLNATRHNTSGTAEQIKSE